jgi:hemolysin activation/secretion protein
MVLRPTLALRAGGQHVWGRYPFHESAFLGGPRTIRGLRRQRYAGDSAAYGNAELRLTLVDRDEAFLSRFGVFGLADGGRVWLAGETSDVWHHGFGGGVFVSVMKPENVWSLAVAHSEGRTRVYLEGGFMF